MADRRLLPTLNAAKALGLSAETLRSWRRRGLGPPYIKYVGGKRNRYDRRYWKEKAHGTIFYPEQELKAFVERLTVEGGRLPRPFSGRFPRGSVGRLPDTPRPKDTSFLTEELQLYSTIWAAICLGVSPETLRSWRRRGIGPPFVRLPGGHTRRGPQPWTRTAHGHIRYSIQGLKAFFDELSARKGKMRPSG